MEHKSLSTGSFPQNWKEANVVLVFKKGEVECTENYRSISLPSLVSFRELPCIFVDLRRKSRGNFGLTRILCC